MLAPLTAFVGLTTSGLLSGLTLAFPLFINQHFTEQQGSKVVPQAPQIANLSIAQRLTLWNRAYTLGAACIPLLDAITVLSLVTFVRSGGSSAIEIRSLSLNRNAPPSSLSVNTLIYSAATMFASHIPFTLLVIKPVNDQLMALRRKANSGESIDEARVERLFSQWTVLHNVRVAAALGGFLTALYAIVRL